MTSNEKYFDQVGAYLDNELSGEELSKFNEELQSNPDLAKEVDYQNELISGIKNYRHAQLKARLDNVPVSGGFLSGSVAKIISGAVIVAGIGYGVYEIMDSPNETTPQVEESLAITTQESEPAENIITETPVSGDPAQSAQEPTEDSTEGQKAIDQTQEKENIEIEPITTPDVPTPEDFTMDEPNEDDLEIPTTELGTEEEPLESQLEIEIISNKRKYPFHYQVVDGRLLLYGDFDEEPYELLEISINNDKKLYLFFKESYYEIEEGSEEITPLQTLSNSSLIEELEKIRTKDL